MSDLTELFSPSRWSKRLSMDVIADTHIKLTSEYSAKVSKQILHNTNVPYGSEPREVFDIYGTDLPESAPIFIYIHGGYWQEEKITHDLYSFISKSLYENRIKTIFVGYELCPKVTLEQLGKNIEKAIEKCLDYAKRHKSRGIYLAGHSAGTQIVARLFETFIPSLPVADQRLFKAVFLIAGVYETKPLIQTKYGEPLKLDDSSAKATSPLLQKQFADGTVFYVIAAEQECPGLAEQSKQFYDHLLSLGLSAKFLEVKDVDHFNIIENLYNKEFELTHLIINVINQ